MAQQVTYSVKNVLLFVGTQSAVDTPATLAGADVIPTTDLSFTVDQTLDQVVFQGDANNRDEATDITDISMSISATCVFPKLGAIAGSVIATTDVPYYKAFANCATTITLSGANAATAKAVISNQTRVDNNLSTVDYRGVPSSLNATLATQKAFKATNSKSTIDISVGVGQRSKITFNFKGAYSDPTEATAITPSYGDLKTDIANIPTAKNISIAELTQWTDTVAPTLLNSTNICFDSIDAPNFFGEELIRQATGCFQGFDTQATPSDVTITVLEDAASGSGVVNWYAQKTKDYAFQLKWADKLTPWTAGTAVTIFCDKLKLVDVTRTSKNNKWYLQLKFRKISYSAITLEASTT